jgi:osmotically-inducible protein OsmY
MVGQTEAAMKNALVLGCVILVSCSRNDTTTSEAVGTTEVTSAATTTGESADTDALLTRRVEAAVASELDLSSIAKNVEVDVTEGVVTLRGAVEKATDKPPMEQLVSQVPGVTHVLDKIAVSPSRAEDAAEIDDRIAFSIQRAFVIDPAVSRDVDRVTIDVSDGRVTLRGSTNDGDARLAVQRVVFETPGVTTIRNLLVVARP